MYLGSPSFAPANYQMGLSPYTGVEDSVRSMVKLAREGQTHPQVRRYAEETIRKVYPKDYLSELAAIYYDVCRRVRYTRDPAGRELLHHPALILRNRTGDCDDQSLLIRSTLGAAALSVGNPSQFVVVGFDAKAPKPQRYTHVFLRALDARTGRWVVVDPVAGPTARTMLQKVRVFKVFDT